MNGDNSGNSVDLSLVGKMSSVCYQIARKEEIIWSMNLIDGFSARGYSTRSIHLPIVLLTLYKLKGSALYLKSWENNAIYFLSTLYGAP